MSNLRVKGWYVEDIMRCLASIYFASKPNRRPTSERDEGMLLGFAAAVSAIAIAVGGNPETILTPEDVQRIKSLR
jgi:uncharacterized membrane protein